MSTSAPATIIATHGRFGEELKLSAELILGPLEHVHCLSLLPGMEPEKFGDQLKQKLEELNNEVVVLTDLFGGTPNNIATAFAARHGLPVLSGVNLPMLIQLESVRKRLHKDGTGIDGVIKAAKDGIRDVTALLAERKRS
jgi:mannose/fructose-specific phosphotransferase system component IIA